MFDIHLAGGSLALGSVEMPLEARLFWDAAGTRQPAQPAVEDRASAERWRIHARDVDPIGPRIVKLAFCHPV